MKAYSKPSMTVKRFESEYIRTGELAPGPTPAASAIYAHYTEDADIMAAKIVYKRLSSVLDYTK